MKTVKTYSGLMYGVGALVAILSITLLYTNPPLLALLRETHWGFLALAIIAMFRSEKQDQHHNKLTHNTDPTFTVKSPSLRSVFFGIMGLQISFLLILIALLTCLTPNTLNTPEEQLSISNILRTLWLGSGLLPWGLVMLLTLRYRRIAYQRSENAEMSRLLFPLIRSTPSTLFGTVLNLQGRLASIAVFSLTFAVIVIQVVSLFAGDSAIKGVLGMNTILAGLLLVPLGFIKPAKTALSKLLQSQHPLMLTLCVAIMAIALLLLLFLGLLLPLKGGSISPPQFLRWLFRSDPKELLTIAAVAFCFGWSPIMANMFATMTQHVSNAKTALFILTAPMLMMGLVTFTPGLFNALLRFPMLISFGAIAGFLFYLLHLTRRELLPRLIRNYLPANNTHKHRDHHFYLRKTFQLSLIWVYLILPGKVYVSALVLFAMTLPFTAQLLGHIANTPLGWLKRTE